MPSALAPSLGDQSAAVLSVGCTFNGQRKERGAFAGVECAFRLTSSSLAVSTPTAGVRGAEGLSTLLSRRVGFWPDEPAPDLTGFRGAAGLILQQSIRCESYCLRLWEP